MTRKPATSKAKTKAKAKALARNDLKAFFLFLSLFVGALLLAVPAFSQTAEVGPAETSATQNVVRDQLEAFKSGDHQRAYSHAAPNITSFFNSVDKFIAMVKGGYSPIYQSESYRMGRNTLVGGQIYQEVFITDPSGKQWQAVYTLKQQADGSWKITGVKMEPYKGAAA